MLHNFRRKAIAKVSKEKRLARVQGEAMVKYLRQLKEDNLEVVDDGTGEKSISDIENLERLSSENT